MGGDSCVFGVAEDEGQVAMGSITEIGVYTLSVCFDGPGVAFHEVYPPLHVRFHPATSSAASSSINGPPPYSWLGGLVGVSGASLIFNSNEVLG
jgi:hypothetical protein